MKKLLFVMLLGMMTVSTCIGASENATKEDIENLHSSIIKKIDSLKEDNYGLVPVKDIDFLYDITIGGDYMFSNNVSILGVDKKIFIDYEEFGVFNWFPDYRVKNENNTTIEVININEYKLQAVEEVLKLKNEDNSTVKSRISAAYEALDYKDWNRDRIKFIVTTNYVKGLDEVVHGVGVEVFPAYKKYISGNIDLIRRYAPYISIGNSDKVDDQVYSMGINIELQNGFGINVGAATYSIDEKRRTKFTCGVVLSSDLWRKLLSLEK